MTKPSAARAGRGSISAAPAASTARLGSIQFDIVITPTRHSPLNGSGTTMLRSLLLATALLATPVAAAVDPVHDATQRQLPRLMTFYRDFHPNPEHSNHETVTSGKLAAEARAAG
jgi:hypothetical protein